MINVVTITHSALPSTKDDDEDDAFLFTILKFILELSCKVGICCVFQLYQESVPVE